MPEMEYLIRFSQSHETFRLPEIEALAVIEGIDLKVISYSLESPFCIVSLPSPSAAQRLISRSILVISIHELWGHGSTLPEVHASVRSRTSDLWSQYLECSFKFTIDSYQGSRTNDSKLSIINSFSYLGFAGPIKMKNPDQEFILFEDWIFNSTPSAFPIPSITTLRRYISTTSMDAELALVTANIALAGPGKLIYDPFVGTGSFPIACAQFGALTFGSDIDGRSIRGDEKKRTLRGNFEQYGLTDCLGGMFTADLTNTPIRKSVLTTEKNDGKTGRIFDAVVCDPPYGVREGLKVLGVKDPEKCPWVIPKGMEMYKDPDFIPPRKPLSFWMPTANDQDQEIPVPQHPYMEVVAVCVQDFNKWSRRLITYRRVPDAEVEPAAIKSYEQTKAERAVEEGKTADDLNPFRNAYFKGFKN
ncbi:hypothetical protein B0T20DRAFT_478041 [Sordaria brevicollis]|uniref:tRNA (guanine(10)-N(2))-methyltransferase TRMT11 N-terminal domain-containing protein n=1 Tax=Sordaria brevicollis TaxID=83679 RepID=A0AAE0PHV4_SORBR|nr:hypothetical protein B0T20DRAFT_478041 [Sordaria brevicollis]